MSLPIIFATAFVQERKLTKYLLELRHPEGATKARYFYRVGFTNSAWIVLAEALLVHARDRETEIEDISFDRFGKRFVLVGPITTPRGDRVTIRSVWQIDTGHESPRLITAYRYNAGEERI